MDCRTRSCIFGSCAASSRNYAPEWLRYAWNKVGLVDLQFHVNIYIPPGNYLAHCNARFRKTGRPDGVLYRSFRPPGSTSILIHRRFEVRVQFLGLMDPRRLHPS
ncbi:hypothetical protein B0H17DRAFT_1184164, partial [Mycena rosella]